MSATTSTSALLGDVAQALRLLHPVRQPGARVDAPLLESAARTRPARASSPGWPGGRSSISGLKRMASAAGDAGVGFGQEGESERGQAGRALGVAARKSVRRELARSMPVRASWWQSAAREAQSARLTGPERTACVLKSFTVASASSSWDCASRRAWWSKRSVERREGVELTSPGYWARVGSPASGLAVPGAVQGPERAGWSANVSGRPTGTLARRAHTCPRVRATPCVKKSVHVRGASAGRVPPRAHPPGVLLMQQPGCGAAAPTQVARRRSPAAPPPLPRARRRRSPQQHSPGQSQRCAAAQTSCGQ